MLNPAAAVAAAAAARHAVSNGDGDDIARMKAETPSCGVAFIAGVIRHCKSF